MAEKPWCYFSIGRGLRVKIDREDLARVGEHSWRVTKGTTGRRRVVTSIRTDQGPRSVTLGKFLMNPPRGKQVYPRRFNDELDYRKDNLVVCTLKERQRLLPKRRVGTSSSFKGVSYSKRDKKWRAAIQVKDVTMNLGLFRSEQAAALAYNAAAVKHFGPGAYQNQVGKRKHSRRE